MRRAFAGEPVEIPAIEYDPNETLPHRTRHAEPRRWVAAVAYPLKDAAGRVREVVLIHQDMTARKRAEAALRESEEKFRLLADTIPQLAWMARPDGYIFWYNRRWHEYTGTTPEQMEGWGWQSVHDPEVLPRVLERWKASIASGEPFDMTFPLRGADGVFRPFLTRVNPLRGDDGKIHFWFGTNTDISAQKRIAVALRDEARTTETLYRIGTVLAQQHHLERIVQTVTDEATSLTGAQFGAFFYNVVSEQGEVYSLFTISGADRAAFDLFPMPRNTAVFAPTFRGEAVVRLDDVTQDPRFGKNAPFQGLPPGHLPVRS